MCGANGLSKIRKALIVDKGIVSTFVKAFTKIIICEIAVLKENDSISSVTFLIVACNNFCCGLVASTSLILADNSHSPAWLSVMSKRQTRARKRATPSTPRVLQGFICSSGPINIS